MNSIKKIKLTKKRIVIISIAAVLVTGSIFSIKTSGTTTETESDQPPSSTGNKGMSSVGDMVTSTGYAVYGTIDQALEVTIGSPESSDYLKVDSVMVSQGDTVKEGDVLFTVTNDSYKAAKAYLEKQLASAEDTLAQEELTYKQAVLDAEYDRLNDSQLADSAKVEYDASVSDLKEQIADAKTAYNEALTVISENPATIKTNKGTITSYTSKLKTIDTSLKAEETRSEKARTAFEKIVSEYKTVLYTYKYLLQLENSSTTEVDKIIAAVEQGTTVTSDDNAPGGNSPSDTKPMSSVSAPTNPDKSLLATVKSTCDSFASTYSTAKSIYDKAVAKITTLTAQRTNYTNKKKTLEQKNSQLQEEYNQAKTNVSILKSNYKTLINKQEAQLVTLKKTYQLSVLTSETAQSTYDKTIASLDESLQTYKDAYTTAKENLTNLTNAFTNCQFKANQSGIVAKVQYSDGDIMVNGVAPISYQDSASVSVTVAVSQENVGSIKVGDMATVMDSTSSRRYIGTVKEIGAEASSDRLSNVTYNVEVALTVEEGTTISTTNSLSVLFGDFVTNMSNGNKNMNRNNADSSQEGAQNEN